MYWMKHQSRQENIAYLVVWGLLFAAPLLSLYVRTVSDDDIAFNWTEVFFVWQRFAVFLFLFLLHNFLLAPLLVHQHRRLFYFSAVLVVLVTFAVCQQVNRPDRDPRPHMERRHFRPEKFEGETPPDFGPDEFSRPDRDHRPDRGPRAERGPRPDMMPLFVAERDILPLVVLILMFGVNLGTKFYFRSRSDQRRLQDLEKQNLEQQLEYLKYQINPHFFMNTLNNIHALVDIDPAKAQETIVELSKMMRFVLYEGNKHGVPLTREFEFIRTYIHLMQLRYTDKVTVTVDLPTEAPDKTIPPLMLVSFIENAFKHGISYQHPSFIDLKIELTGDQLHFLCRNSKADMPNPEKGGVGLANVRQRLNLLYDHHYSLNINDADAIYTVDLTIPLKS